MQHDALATTSTPGKAALWTGRVFSGLLVAMLIMSAVMKFTGGPEFAAGLALLGIPVDLVATLAVIELSCVALYLLPQTAVLGAVLITGYLGGAVFAHVRIGDPFVGPLVFGVLAWAGLYLRDPRLRRLLPLRSV